jgi:uncharacterized protein (DUF58 family)
MRAATVRQQFFSSDFLAQLERLSLASRRSFRGRVKGERRNPRKGQSIEFSDYRAYGVGDDLRYVDWNIYGRTDRLHVKLFVDEEDLCLHLLLDASASMGFGQPSKLDYGTGGSAWASSAWSISSGSGWDLATGRGGRRAWAQPVLTLAGFLPA